MCTDEQTGGSEGGTTGADCPTGGPRGVPLVPYERQDVQPRKRIRDALDATASTREDRSSDEICCGDSEKRGATRRRAGLSGR